MIQEGDKTAETDATRSNSPQPSPSTCSNEQLANLQKAIENGFTSMASSMGSMFQKAFVAWEKLIREDDNSEQLSNRQKGGKTKRQWSRS